MVAVSRSLANSVPRRAELRRGLPQTSREKRNDTGGLRVQLPASARALGISTARDAYESLKAGLVDGLSIGYDVIRQAAKDGKRYLKELRLYEVSLVIFPANELAVVSAVKSRDDESADLVEIGTAIQNLADRLHWKS